MGAIEVVGSMVALSSCMMTERIVSKEETGGSSSQDLPMMSLPMRTDDASNTSLRLAVDGFQYHSYYCLPSIDRLVVVLEGYAHHIQIYC